MMWKSKKRLARERQQRIDRLRGLVSDAAHAYAVYGSSLLKTSELCSFLRREDNILLLDTLLNEKFGEPWDGRALG